ncbi:olfactory receptor 1019-like [Hypomesus transpacificus]|uniref:olfactory receptor 1019-like n=1 Tax=Hypomesus transpacificus TaxID=137520 RepID=UPI001F07CAD9|nr:olfactory receptor 1019-like [Hypomesus transpacificus]
MKFQKRTSGNDSVLIHPPGFYIVAFTSLSFINVYLVFLAFVYTVTVIFNVLVIYIIVSDYRLHTPKFVAVVNLAVIDVVLSSCIIPSMIKLFLSKDNFIPFNLCFVQMFIYYCFVSLESFALAVLAYDRLIAICFPLRQHSINNTRSMFVILAIIWSACVGVTIFTTSIMTRLSFCGSVQVFSYFCDYAPVFRLACNDNRLQWACASILSLFNLAGPLSFIILSYACILLVVFRMKTVARRLKALATCTEHLILVAIFYIPIMAIFFIGLFSSGIDPDLRVLSLSLSTCIPPCLNPIIYSLKTKEIKTRVLALIHKVKFTR